MKEEFFKCKICGHIFEDGESTLIFEEPQKKGVKGNTFLICDTSEQSMYSKDLCITKFVENLSEKRLNFRRLYIIME